MADRFRPAYHVTDPDQFINDPNGPVFYDGEYHMFFQCGHVKSWGHAVSSDLVHWTRLPPALEPDGLGDIWSGCTVVDANNTSGFFRGGTGGLVAVFTHHTSERQAQSLAWSSDRGRTWTKFDGNPVLESPTERDFRDPKVFWHAPTNRWAMVLATGDHVSFYASDDLKSWRKTGTFGAGHGDHAGVWECPDLFELPVTGPSSGERRWVLMVSTLEQTIFTPGGPNAGAAGVQYFVGRFDGETFHNDNPPGTVLRLVHGPDEYATTTFANVPGGRRLAIGWLSHWQYAGKVPTSPWKNMLSVPREVRLVATPDGPRLVQQPAQELEAMRGRAVWSVDAARVSPSSPQRSAYVGDRAEIVAEFRPAGAKRFGLRLRLSATQQTALVYDVASATLELDRGRSGVVDFHPAFATPARVRVPLIDGVLRLRILMDRCSLEAFANDGLAYLPLLVFPDPDATGAEVFAEGGDIAASLCAWELPGDRVS